MTEMIITRSKSGLPTVTECGGGMKNTGYATIVCGATGKRLKPLFVPKGRSNGDHAIFVVIPGVTHLVGASVSRQKEIATIEKIVAIDEDDNLLTEIVGEYENGDYGNVPNKFKAAVQAAIKKGQCYHCREAHYLQD